MFNVGSVFRMVLSGRFTAGGGVGSWAFHWYLSAGSTPFTFQEIEAELGEVAETLATAAAANQNQLWQWEGYSVATLDQDNVSGPLYFVAPIVGIQTGEMLPSQTTLQIKFPTGHSRRILKKAVMGLSEGTTQANGLWTGAALAVWLGFAQSLMGVQEATNSGWLYCYRSPGFPPENALLFPNTFGVSAVPKVQRRRRAPG